MRTLSKIKKGTHALTFNTIIKKLQKSKRSQLQVSFGWLFAIIVGGFILVLAIYGVTKVIKTGETATGAQTGKEISVLLNPLETGFESSTSTMLSIPVQTRIHNDCTSSGIFGAGRISLEQQSFNQWSSTDVDIAFQNKYIFSDGVVEGKSFYLFSKPFNFPFKVSDVIYLTSADQEYCFIGTSKDIKDEINGLKQANLFTDQCPAKSINVCFGGGQTNCDVTVNENLKSVEKRGQIVYYETNALMYAAVFSDEDIYECQVKRLLQKTGELAKIYDGKTSIISKQGCTPEVNVLALEDSAKSYQDSSNLVSIAGVAQSADDENSRAECELW